MAEKNVPQRDADAVDQAAINSARGYKVTLIRETVPGWVGNPFSYVATEGKTDAEVDDEKSVHEALGFKVFIGPRGKECFDLWCAKCEREKNDHGLSEAALDVLRTQFAVNC